MREEDVQRDEEREFGDDPHTGSGDARQRRSEVLVAPEPTKRAPVGPHEGNELHIHRQRARGALVESEPALSHRRCVTIAELPACVLPEKFFFYYSAMCWPVR